MLRLGAWKLPRSAEGVFIRPASWFTSMPANFFIWANCLSPGILPSRPVEAPSCIISCRIIAKRLRMSATSFSLRPEPWATRRTRFWS